MGLWGVFPGFGLGDKKLCLGYGFCQAFQPPKSACSYKSYTPRLDCRVQARRGLPQDSTETNVAVSTPRGDEEDAMRPRTDFSLTQYGFI
jgi:hypothetical protein